MIPALTAAVLLGLTAACGGAVDEAAAGTAGEAAKATSGAKIDTTVTGTGMKGGCDAVRKIFAALDAGDRRAAESLRTKGDALFEEVAATSATGDLDVAMDGATMASEIELSLPEGPIYRSGLATQYAAICVAEYDAAALPG